MIIRRWVVAEFGIAMGEKIYFDTARGNKQHYSIWYTSIISGHGYNTITLLG